MPVILFMDIACVWLVIIFMKLFTKQQESRSPYENFNPEVARFRVGEFDSEKECAAGNEVSAITRHRIFVCGLGVGEGMVCCLRFWLC